MTRPSPAGRPSRAEHRPPRGASHPGAGRLRTFRRAPGRDVAGPVRRLAGIALAALALVFCATPAGAHTELTAADPADGTTHDGALEALTLTYTLPVTPLGDAVVVTGPDGDVPVAVTQRQDGAVVVATPSVPLTDGRYSADWNVAAQDGHPLRGTVRFTVTGAPEAGQDDEAGRNEGSGEEADGDQGEEQDEDRDGDSPGGTDKHAGMSHGDAGGHEGAGGHGTPDTDDSAVSRVADALGRLGNAAAIWGLLVAAGGLVFAGTVLRGPDRVDVPAALAVVRWTGALILAGLAIRLVARTVIVARGDALAVVSAGAYADALAGTTRWVFLLQAAGAVAILVGTHHTFSGSRLAITGAAFAGAGHVVDGHSLTGAVQWLVVVTDVAHLTAAATWVGGLVMTGVVLRRRRKEGRTLDAGLLGARYSVVAGLSLVVLGFAGIVLAVAILDRPAQLWESAWGRLLLAKVALVALVGLVGAYNHFRLVPHLERPGRTARSAHRAVSRMERSARFESVLLALVVLVTAWLVTTSAHE